MKNKLLYIAGGGLGILSIIMVVGATMGHAQETDAVPYDAASFVDYYCFGGKLANMDIGDIVKEYKKQTNTLFNTRIAAIMSNPAEEVPNPSLDDYATYGNGLCTSTGGTDLTCQSIAVCNGAYSDATLNPTNHPYCMGVTLLGVPPVKYDHYDYTKLKALPELQYSYFCLKSALDKKRDDIYDSTPQGILAKCGNSDYADKDICKLKDQLDAESDPNKKIVIQDKLNYELSQRRWWSTSYQSAATSLTGSIIDFTDSTGKKAKFIDEELIRAKTALDQTLDAYGQLRTSWQMHVRYVDIYQELVKYRDHIVEVRKQTDAFPIKFIDATTTKCL